MRSQEIRKWETDKFTRNMTKRVKYREYGAFYDTRLSTQL